MRKIVLFIGLILVSCSSDLEIMDPQPAVPVVYAFINPYDSVQYVRVQRTFNIKQKEDWATLKNDSLLFQDVEVIFQGKKGDSVCWIEKLEKSVAKKDSGFFPSGSYQVYKLDHPFPIKLGPPDGLLLVRYPDIDSLVLTITTKNLNLTTKASAEALPPGRFHMYTSLKTIDLYSSKPTIFAVPVFGESMCVPTLKDPCYYQIEFTVNYKDWYAESYVSRRITWKSITGFILNEYKMAPGKLFNHMRQLLPENDAIITRTLDSIDVTVLAPNKTFCDYWSLYEHWENSDRPPYTNFSNSYGLFFTIVEARVTGMTLDRRSLDSLCYGESNRIMKFRYW